MRKLNYSHPTARSVAGTPVAMMWLLAFVLAALVTVGCGKTVGETIDDTTITTRVKTAMLNDPAVGGLRIDVDTFKGVVTLSGRVKSQAERDQAIALARSVDGVTQVQDALQVIPEN
jgi:osmotically-inducible protein OsmY